MAEVSATHHLIQRNGVWNYRRRVPTALVEALGKRTIQFSHATTKLAEAKKRRAVEDLKWDLQFEALAAQQQNAEAGHQSTTLKQIPPHEVFRLVQEYVERADQRGARQFAQDPPESEDQKRVIRQD